MSWVHPGTSFVASSPFYNGSLVHQVTTNGLIHFGSITGDGLDGPGYVIQDELHPLLQHDQAGVVSMVSSGIDSGGAQFLIAIDSAPELDGVNSVFGKVVEGLPVLDAIAGSDTDSNGRPLDDIVITNVYITRNGADAQNFVITNQGVPEVSSVSLSIGAEGGVFLSGELDPSCEQTLYGSADLESWVALDEQYKSWSDSSSLWTVSVSNAVPRFFHENRVLYTVDENLPFFMINHTLTLTVFEEGAPFPLVFVMLLEDYNAGTVSFNGAPADSVPLWDYERAEDGPYHGVVYVETDYPDAYRVTLHYDTVTGGRCELEYYEHTNSAFNLLFTADGTFLDSYGSVN